MRAEEKQVPSKQLIEKRNEIEAKRTELGKLFQEAKNEAGQMDVTRVKSLGEGLTSVKFAEEVRKRNDEITALKKEEESMAFTEQVEADNLQAQQKSGGNGNGMRHGEPGTQKDQEDKPQTKTLGELFLESDAYKHRNQPGLRSNIQVNLKTLFQTTAGWAPESLRTGRMVDFATRQPRMVDVMPMTTTKAAAVKYMEETTFTNNAAETAEAAEKPEAALALTERTVVLETIAVWIPVTEQQLEDVPRVAEYIDRRLRFMVRQRLDGQLAVGNGVSPNILGILNKPLVGTQAKGGDPTPDTIRKAITKCRVDGQAEPNAFVTHPNDWQEVVLLRTVDGIYIWGNPFQNAGPERIWGLVVVENQGITEGTGVVGDFANFSELVTHGDVQVEVGYINDQFIKNTKTVRAEMRAAALWYRPKAFCLTTGI